MAKEPKDTVEDVVLEAPLPDVPTTEAAPQILQQASGIMGRIVANITQDERPSGLRGRPPGAVQPYVPVDPNLPPLPEPFKGCRIITDPSEAAAWKEAVATHIAAKEESVV